MVQQRIGRSVAGRRLALHTRGLGAACGCHGCWMRRWWTPERKAAFAEKSRARWAAEGVRLRMLRSRQGDRWMPEHDATLRRLAGTMPLAGLQARLLAEYRVPRTDRAIRTRMATLGLSMTAARPPGQRRAAWLLGVAPSTVDALRRRGLLTATAWQQGPLGYAYVYHRADLEAFVRSHPAAYALARIRDRDLRAVAETAQRGRRLVTTTAAAAQVGAYVGALSRWYRAGLVPSARKISGGACSRTGGRSWVIDAADLPVVARLWAEHQARQAASLAATGPSSAVAAPAPLRTPSEASERLEAVL